MKRVLLLCVLVLGLALPAAAAPPPWTITVPDAVYGGTAIATVVMGHPPVRGGEPLYVFPQCYVDGVYVYAAYFAVVNGQATLGPLSSFLWPSGPASCVATVGYFTHKGFGDWVPLATTAFEVVG